VPPVAVIPSTVRYRGNVHVAPLVQADRSIGRWVAVNWDRRRFLPPFARRFVDDLALLTRHQYPGKEFERIAPLARSDSSARS
jgi:hypothetical protein